MSTPSILSGQCLCGGVRLSATRPTRRVTHGPCSRCRRAHGKALVTWAGFASGPVGIDAST